MRLQTVLRFALLIWMGSLFALLALQRFVIEPLGSPLASAIVFVAQAAPLLVLAPLVIRPGVGSVFWAALIMPLYLIHGVWQGSVIGVRLIGALEVAFALGAFVTAWFLLRVTPREEPTTKQ